MIQVLQYLTTFRVPESVHFGVAEMLSDLAKDGACCDPCVESGPHCVLLLKLESLMTMTLIKATVQKVSLPFLIILSVLPQSCLLSRCTLDHA